MNPTKAIGIEIGKIGWKNTAVKKRLAVFANLFAISRGGPSHSLIKDLKYLVKLQISFFLSHQTVISFASCD